ncbi:nuclear pore complex protein Nup205-like isoform X3 [Pomacea canaliculata]|uniref:nuclear pore complex protein Nup205-like isoform X3 n=1 Tax=Pomacea canaliculata TaxID=400727 RepID=UPI000D72CD54|nr:nuclear pore complex protein Nup205-like isoform X3 [Pomacea canaliculata]
MADTGSMAVNLGARLWAPYRALQDVVNAAIHKREAGSIHDLELALRRHKPDFISLLKVPPKNAAARQIVSKATTEGLHVQGGQRTQIFSQQFVAEALILSDLFQMDELAAVELLMAGENQRPNYPGLPRGLVAVLLFYDGRRSLVSSLRSLLQAREGHTWTLGLPSDVVHLVTHFTSQLLEDKLVHKILDLIQSMDLAQELDRLQKQRALGPPRHKKQVIDLFKEIKQTLAECLFCLASQRPLNKAETLRLVVHLQTDISLQADQTMDPVSLCLLMTLLSCFDTSPLEHGDAEVQATLPLVDDNTYLGDVHLQMKSDQWATSGIRAVSRFTWGLMLRKLSQYPNYSGNSDLLEDDEQLVEQAIEDDLFPFLSSSVVAAHEFHHEEFYVRRVHCLLTDFILHMPLRVKELRNRGDETARLILAHQIEGIEPPPQRRDFQHLLELIGDVYRHDPLNLELSLEYWCPVDPVAANESAYSYRPPPRQVALFKFVRLAGDLLPAPLFVPYLQMLTGLASSPQCAQHAFNLLKMNGISSGGSASSVSWDHFFDSLIQYYASMRQESPAVMEHVGVPFRPPPVRTITPQELEGLCAVLKLTRTIAEQNEVCRGSLYENQRWSVVATLFGLLGCSVAVSLKAELLLTLAALSQTPLIAATVWHSLEASQILPTIPSEKKGGIGVELEEIESRNEEYPMTRAFLQLLNVLTDIPIPPGLGAGLRAPGFDPYMDFIIQSVLLKLNSRAYKDAGEKWQVLSSVLEILFKLLRDHEVSENDFRDELLELPSGGTVSASKPPGFILLQNMLNDSSLFKMVMRILDEAVTLCETYASFSGRLCLEQAALLCLQMLVAAAEKQEDFEVLIRQMTSSIMITSMDKLLLSVNPKTRRPDYLVTIAKFVIFNTSLAYHAFAAVKILYLVSRMAPTQSDLINLFTADSRVSQELQYGFVECLECDSPEEASDDEQENEGWSVGRIQNSLRQHVVRLLLQSLQGPTPNLAHWLLGFQIHKSVSKTNLQDPGVMESPRTCLHAILSLLEQGVEGGHGPRCLHEMPCFAELAYQLIYKLCASRDTSAPTLRYLRTTHDFLYQQLRHLPFIQSDYKVSIIPHQSWLLKTVAIELRMTALNRQRSHCQRLIRLLLGDDDTDQTQVLKPVGGEESEMITWDQEQTQSSAVALIGKQMRNKLLSLLDTVDFTHQFPPELQLTFFDPKMIEAVLSNHEVQDAEGVAYYDVRSLRRLLIAELDNQQGPMMSGQRPLIMEEIQNLLTVVVKRNSVRERLHQQRQNFQAWRQVAEILLTACPEDLLSGEKRQLIIMELLQELLAKVAAENTIPESTAPVSGVVLTFMANLRQGFLNERLPLTHDQQMPPNTYISLLDRSSLTGAGAQSSPWSQGASSKVLFATSLQILLKGLIEYILSSRSGQQRVRANLYGSLLYYLQIAQKPSNFSSAEAAQGMERVLSGGDTGYEQLSKENLSTIFSFGEAFMEVVCRDACDGHDVCRMLALSVLDSIMAEDKFQQWLSFLVTKGYLQHLVDSLPLDDSGLHAALAPVPSQLRPLYIFQSKMSMLTRAAQTAEGARKLLRCNVMPRLAACTALDLRPETTSYSPLMAAADDSFIPDPLARYRLILWAALRLCLALLTSLGVENKEAASQVMMFIVSHGEIFYGILHNRSSSLSYPAMKELALTTAIVSRANCQVDLASEFLDTVAAQVEFQSHCARLHRQMMMLLPRFTFSEKFSKQLQNLSTQRAQDGKDIAPDITLVYQQIACNITAYCRAVISVSSGSYNYSRILFGPSLDEASARDNIEELSGMGSLSTYQAPSLGIVVYQLRQCANQFQAVSDSHRQHQRKLSSIHDLSSEDLKQLSDVTGSEKMSSHQRQAVARQRLHQIVASKSQELQHLSYILENCLFIIWRHLEYYLLRCVPSNQQPLSFQSIAQRQRQMRHLQDTSWVQEGGGDLEGVSNEMEEAALGVTREDLQTLKKNAPVVLNETLLKKILDINQSYCKRHTHYSFTEAIVRRIKRLLLLHTGN